jgi:hypothetical protein
MKEFSSCVTVSAVAAEKINALRATEMQRLANVKERRSACEIGIVVNDVLADLIGEVNCQIEEDLPVLVALCKGTVPSGRRRELAWATRSRMIGFHLHPDLGARDPNIFNTVFGHHVVHVETMRGWFRKEVVYKWLDIITNLCKNDIMAVVHEKYCYIFPEGGRRLEDWQKGAPKVQVYCRLCNQASSLQTDSPELHRRHVLTEDDKSREEK